MREEEIDSKSGETVLSDRNRRTILKALGVAGIVGTGAAGFSGTAAADDGETELGALEIEEVTVYAEESADGISAGDELGTFSGELEIDESGVADTVDLEGSEEDALAAIDVTEGKLKGEFDSSVSSLPSGEVEAEWEGSPLLQILGLDSGDGECPILFLELGPLFLDLLGLQVSLSQITLDITAVAGEGNLLGNLLCAVAGLLDDTL